MEKKIRSPILAILGHVDHGKCITPNTVIPLADGRILTAENIYKLYIKDGEARKVKDGLITKVRKGPIVFSLKKNKVIKKRVSHIWKLKSPKKLVDIKLRSGDKITTTLEHPFFILEKNGDIIEKKASDIKPNDYVAVPNNLSFATNDLSVKKIIINKLKNINNFIVFLNDKKCHSFLKKLSSINLKEYKSRGLITTDPSSCILHRRFRSRDFINLANDFGFSDTETYEMIDSIKNSSFKWRAGHTSNKLKLPKNKKDFEKMGYILGVLAGDGYISEGISHNNDKGVQSTYREYVKTVFGLESKIKQGHTCQQVFTNGGKTFERFLIDILGFPDHNKSSLVEVPLLAQTYEQMHNMFIGGFFDTDGYISPINHTIEITSKSEKIIKQVSIMLLGFGIHSTIFKKGGYNYLRIGNSPYLKEFLDTIHINCKLKLDGIQNSTEKSSTSRIFDLTPIPGSILKKIKILSPNKKIPYFTRYYDYKELSRPFLRKLIKHMGDGEHKEKIKRIVDGDISFVKVLSKVLVRSDFDFVYDFTVPETHCFIAERIFVHNTTLLDNLRGTTIAKAEPGLITQYISSSYIPTDIIQKICGPLLKQLGTDLTIPGLLFIDTPGHEAFTTLRKRGGAIADLAVLVIDINQGVQPQTDESLNFLKQFKTPFVVALTKIDKIPGWNPIKDIPFFQTFNEQTQKVQEFFEEKLYGIIAKLTQNGFQAERYDRVSDYTKQVAIVPVSSKTGEGIPDLLMILAGVAQKYLDRGLELKSGEGKGTVLEVKEFKGLGTTIDVILYDGEIKRGDYVVIGCAHEGSVVTKVKALLEPKSLNEFRSEKDFLQVERASAATGIKISAPNLDAVVAGTPLRAVSNKRDVEKAQKEVCQEIEEVEIESEKRGSILKADTLGSLEALIKSLRDNDIPVRKAHVGNVTKTDIMEIRLLENPVIFVFGLEPSDEIIKMAKDNAVKIFSSPIIYNLLEDYKEWMLERRKRNEETLLETVVRPGRIRVLRGYVFRQKKPAVFGVEVLKGTIKSKYKLKNGKRNIGEIREIQLSGTNVKEAHEGDKVAISMDDVTIGKEVNEGNVLEVLLRNSDLENLEKIRSKLSEGEIEILDEYEN